MTNWSDSAIEAAARAIVKDMNVEEYHWPMWCPQARAALSTIDLSGVRGEVIEECADAAAGAAWRHIGKDDFSTGLDSGARHQMDAVLAAIRALVTTPPTPDPRDAEIDRLRQLLRKVADTGLIYWEPRTASGATNRSLMFAEIERALEAGTRETK